jgi:hypothetical protein
MIVDGSGSRAPRLETIGPPGQLVPLPASRLRDGPWCPDAADVEAFDADLLRVRRVDLRLRFGSPPGAAERIPAPISIAASTALRQR